MSALTRRIHRPTPALIVAIVALFMALGGTSYAALKVTGKNVQNGTLTGADVKNKSLGKGEFKRDTLTGAQIDESALGTVPNATSAENAVNAQTANKALDADAVGGIPAAQLMTTKTRGYETSIPQEQNFPTGSPLHSLNNLPPGTYLITARLSYSNPGVTGQESCTLDVPGADDVATFTVEAGDTEAISLQELTTSASQFNAFVHCTSDGNDDLEGTGTIIALRLD